MVLNVVLLIAVAVLFYLHFSSPRTASDVTSDNGNDTASVKSAVNSSSRIYFVDIDSLSRNYQFFNDLEKDIQAKSASIEANYNAYVKKYQEKYIDYQKRLEANSISVEEATKVEKELGNLERNIQAIEGQKEEIMYDMELAQREALAEVDAYLEEYKKGKNIDYILGKMTVVKSLLYADSSLDITGEVLKAMNDRYKEKMQSVTTPQKK